MDSSCTGSCLDNAVSQRDSSLCPFLGMSFHTGGTCTQPNPQEFQPSQYSHSPWPSGLKEAQFRLRSLGWKDTFFRVFHHRMCSLFSPFLQTPVLHANHFEVNRPSTDFHNNTLQKGKPSDMLQLVRIPFDIVNTVMQPLQNEIVAEKSNSDSFPYCP